MSFKDCKLNLFFLSSLLVLFQSVKSCLAHLPHILIFPVEPALLLGSAHH